jgi:beta-lactam-binding protein with PASTA domain
VYYDYDEPSRRPIWPWLLALLFVVAAIVGGYFLYRQIQHQLSSSTVRVDNYVGIHEFQADRKIKAAGLVPNVIRQPNASVAETLVFRQIPQPGTKENKGGQVTIYSSTGKPQVAVPDLRGETATDAVARLKDAKLNAKIVHVTSNLPTDQVIGQDPTAGASVDQGSTVKLKVSKGPQPIAVPNVVGDNVQVATSTLQGAGFAVATKHADSSQPKDTVFAQNPSAGTSEPPGTTITLQVSNGPKTSAVPDVTSQTQSDATDTLRASGFGVKVETQPTNDPNSDGVVLTQTPQGGTPEPKGFVVTIVVGKFAVPGPP